MHVVLCRNRRELALRRAELLHVNARERSIDVHEDAVWLRRGGSRRDIDPLAELKEPIAYPIGVMDIPSAVENREHAIAIRRVHLLGAHRQNNVCRTGLEMRVREGKRSRTARTGVLDIDDRNAADPHRAQRDLPTDHVLPLHVSL